MIWNTDSIQKLLDLCLKQPVLWDPKHSHYGDKVAREKAHQIIAEQMDVPNITAEDINRKYRSMRAAYRVEVRNINTAKIRGFFYKPTLHWFSIFKQYMKQIEDRKKVNSPIIQKQLLLQRDLTDRHQYVFTLKDDPQLPVGPINKNLPPQVHLVTNTGQEIHLDEDEESSEEEMSSEESEDEFQSFADHIAVQLRSMSVHRAVMIQNQIQKIFAQDREIHEITVEEDD
ncbi:uncharacterized protein LOC114361013 [Ostrinia furnacalis]|uniref:uncharacterized protein LOC114361013 n=1 Tax=Ostrinia furnacalis TaxID=93504 RepID=UPI00103AF921|nr:uncharacterized protein LOC114361013 [Ostrinia furnacalis]